MNKVLVKIFIIQILIIPLFVLQAYGQVYPLFSIDNSSRVEEVLNSADKDTLVLIDIDYTLVAPKAKIFCAPANPYYTLIDNLISYSQKNGYYDAILGNWYITRKLQLVEEGWIPMIEKFKSKGAIVLGFINMDKTWYDLVKEPELVRYKELSGLGINFTKTVAGKDLFSIEAYENRQAIFYYGIIFNGPFTKIEALLSFLKVTSIMPTKIVVFEHDEMYVEHLYNALLPLNIQYYGFYYQGMRKFNQVYADPNAIKLQQKLLLEEGKWLEDDEAEKYLANQNSKQ